ncbi:hypothetical protein B0H19DRAFT_1066146 [Mycena capillaripes]|nr:hypothetical protein B0H19DRAFT_1066146 [Mycena capillaripes]
MFAPCVTQGIFSNVSIGGYTGIGNSIFVGSCLPGTKMIQKGLMAITVFMTPTRIVGIPRGTIAANHAETNFVARIGHVVRVWLEPAMFAITGAVKAAGRPSPRNGPEAVERNERGLHLGRNAPGVAQVKSNMSGAYNPDQTLFDFCNSAPDHLSIWLCRRRKAELWEQVGDGKLQGQMGIPGCPF